MRLTTVLIASSLTGALAAGCPKGSGSGGTSATIGDSDGATDAGTSGDGSSGLPTTAATGEECPPPPSAGMVCEGGSDGEYCCYAEESAMYCCGLTIETDPPASAVCIGEIMKLASDPDTEHCVELLTALFSCTSNLGCAALEPYAIAAVNGGMAPDVTTFAGLACESEAIAVLDAGCPIITTAVLPKQPTKRRHTH